jgi:hypothetical protein
MHPQLAQVPTSFKDKYLKLKFSSTGVRGYIRMKSAVGFRIRNKLHRKELTSCNAGKYVPKITDTHTYK